MTRQTLVPRYSVNSSIVSRRVPWLLRVVLNPAMAFALAFPTIGYYTAQTYASLLGFQDSAPAIAFRATSIVIAVLVFVTAGRLRSKLPAQLTGGIIFLFLYFARMVENIVFQDIIILPSNEVVLLNFAFNLLLPSIVMAAMWRGIDFGKAQMILSLVAVLFAAGALLLVGRLIDTPAGARLDFEKVNPIALAYVCSTFLLYYLVAAQHSRRVSIEAALVAPVLVLVAARAQSRGMMISTAACVLLYFVLTRGGRRVVALFIGGAVALVAFITVEPRYLEVAMRALDRIGTEHDLSTSMRVISFQGALEQFLADPIIGRYVQELITGYYPHNIYLESLMAVGLTGTLLFCIHLIFATVAAIGVLRTRNIGWFWPFIALLYFREAIAGAASGSIWGNNGLWITSFMLIAMWFRQNSRGSRAPNYSYSRNSTKYVK